MPDAAIDIAYSTLLVFVFGAVARVRRPDDRAYCWFAGWLALLASYAAILGQSFATGWPRLVAGAVRLDLTAMVGVLFVVSSAISARCRRFGIFLGAKIAIPTLLCLTLAALGVESRWLLAAAVLARQLLLIRTRGEMSRYRPRFSLVLTVLWSANAVLLLALIARGSARWLAPVILAEVFTVAGMDIVNRRTGETIGMRLTGFGMVVWAATYPIAEAIHGIWPQITACSGFWNPPKACVAVGMMLIVFEEGVESERALASEYRLIFYGNPNALWIFDVKTLRILAVNDAACALHGYTREEFLKLRLPDLLHPEMHEQALREAAMPNPVPNRASRHLRKDGAEFRLDITVYSIVFHRRPCRFVLAVDVTNREYLEKELEYQQYHDALTGLENRRAFEERLRRDVAEAIANDKKLAILCIDLHNLKRLNEVYGPRTGDLCIQFAASVLSAHARPGDAVARTGDGEFALVLTGLSDLTAAEQMTARFNEEFEQPVWIGGYEVPLAFNIGLAVCPEDGVDALTLWRLAESALHRAQTEGSGQVVWLSPELRSAAEKRLEIASSITRMLEEDRFHLVYQPLYTSDGTVSGLEALLRLNHPRYGAIEPSIVVRTAEETGLIAQIGNWVVEHACRQLRAWMDEGVELVPLALNVSAMELISKGYAERLAQTLERYSISDKWIHLEITETAAMDNLKAVSGEMGVLSALGCHFAIDDFGTGHSSLGRLHQLPISILKIDRSFVERLCKADKSETSSDIVQAILSMAHALGLQVVAEGVETECQLARLRQLKCDLFQGFLLSLPLLPEEVPPLLGRKHPAFNAAPAAPQSRAQGGSPQEAEAGVRLPGADACRLTAEE